MFEVANGFVPNLLNPSLDILLVLGSYYPDAILSINCSSLASGILSGARTATPNINCGTSCQKAILTNCSIGE